MPTEHPRRARIGRLARAACTMAFAAAALAPSGCVLAPFLRASELHGTKDVTAKYTGLEGKTFAVIVAADRSIQATYPMLVPQVTTTVSKRLFEKVGATMWIPPEDVMAFQYQHPQWTTWTLKHLSEELGVERLVFIDIQEFRLNEPGNQYLWKGAAGGIVGVVEAENDASESFSFSEQINVRFPTKETGLSPSQTSWDQVQTMLALRFVDRASWLFFDHEEANMIDY